jgi:hypothetical protein
VSVSEDDVQLQGSRMKKASVNPELIAAFLDRKLSPQERERLVQELADSPEALEVFSETARTLADVERKRGKWGQLVARFGSSPTYRVALAAVIAALLIVPVWLVRRSPAGLDLLDGATLAALDLPSASFSWGASRDSLGAPASLSEEQRDSRIGVSFADFDAARDQGNVVATAQNAALVTGLLRQADAANIMAARFERLSTPPAPAEQTQWLAEARAIPVKSLAGLLSSPWFELGFRVEQVRLASKQKDSEFFQPRVASGIRLAIGRIAGQQRPGDDDTTAAVRTLLADLQALQDTHDYARVEQASEQVLSTIGQ